MYIVEFLQLYEDIYIYIYMEARMMYTLLVKYDRTTFDLTPEYTLGQPPDHAPDVCLVRCCIHYVATYHAS